MFLRSPTARLHGRRYLAPAILAALLALPAQAESLTLRDAVAAALNSNPELNTYEFRLKAADAVRDQAAFRPSPELSIDVENFAGSGTASGFGESDATLMLSQVVELGGKRGARIAIADASYESVIADRRAAQLDVLAEVARRYIDVAELQELVTLSSKATQLAERTLRTADRRVDAGKAPHVEVDRATVALGQTKLEQRQLESRLDAARQQLSAMWGRDDGTLNGQPVTAVRGDLFRLPAQSNYATLVERLAVSPDFLRFASEERLRDANLRLANAQSTRDWTVGGGVRRMQGTEDTAFVASLSIPLFVGRRAEAGIAEARAERERLEAEKSAAMVKAKSQIYSLHRALRDATDAVKTLDAVALPRIEEALQETEYAFERGRYGYLELTDAQREYLEIQRSRIEASAKAQRIAAEIERLTSAPVSP